MFSSKIKKDIISITLSVLGSLLGVAIIVYASTTIGSSISTGGDLTVSGIVEFLSNLTVGGDLAVSGDTTLATTTLSGTLDLSQKELKQAILEKLSAFPSSPAQGQMFWSTASNTPYWYTGSEWKGDVSGATYVVAASDSVNKEKADYICDGASDQTEINAAINALPASGGRVLLLEGTYYIDDKISLSYTNNNHYVTLEGQGDGTLLTIPDGHDADMNLILVQGDDSTNVVQHPTIKNLRLDGNSANVGADKTYNGIQFHFVDYGTVENVVAVNGGGDDGYAVIFISVTNSRILGLKKGTFEINSFELRDSEQILVSDCILDRRAEIYTTSNDIIIKGNIFNNAQLNARTLDNGERINNLQVVDNFFEMTTDDTFNPAIWGRYIDGLLFSGNYATSTGTSLVYLVDSNDVNIVGNTIYCDYSNINFSGSNGQIVGNYISIPGVSVSGPAIISDNNPAPSNLIISNNTIKSLSNSAGAVGAQFSNGSRIYISENYFINLYQGIKFTASAVSNAVIKGNTFTSLLYDKIVNSGTNTAISGNIGYLTASSSTATITSGNTSVDVSHSLAITPSAGNISVTPTNDMGSATKFWISDIGASTFRINVDQDPGGNATFSWQIVD